MSKKPFMRTLEEITILLATVIVANLFFLLVKTVFPPEIALIILFACIVFIVYLIYRENKKQHNK